MERSLTNPDRRAIARVIAALIATIFIAECLVPHTVAVGGLYVLPVILTRWLRRRRSILKVAGICSALTLLSGLFVALVKTQGTDASLQALWAGVANHAVSLFVIWVTAQLTLLRAGIELRLAQERETTATTLESIAEAVVTTDPDGRVDFLNAAAERLLGWDAEEATGLPLDDVFVRWDRRAPEGRGHREGRVLFEDTLPTMRETAIRTQEGRVIPVEASLAAIRPKDEVDELEGEQTSPRGQVLVFRDISERKRYQEAVEDLAYRDTLTGLPNRNSFLDRLDLEIAHAKRHGEPLALLFLDMDGFKAINDTYGHHAGDLFLKGVAARLRTCVREEDTVARLSGDEFTIILSRVSSLDNARKVAQKIVQRLIKAHEIEGAQVTAPPSVGIALFPNDAEDLESLLRRADHAMYRAKQAGGARAFDWEQDAAQAGLFDDEGAHREPAGDAGNGKAKSVIVVPDTKAQAGGMAPR